MAGWKPPTLEQQEEFLGHIAEGKTRPQAAELVGCTGSQFRTLINGSDATSQAFAERYLEAMDLSGKSPPEHSLKVRDAEKIHLARALWDEAVMRALDKERGANGSSNRMLHTLSLLTVEDFKPLLEARMHKHVHSGAVGLFAALPKLDTSQWTIGEQEEFVQLEARRAELLAKASMDPKALPSGSGDSRHSQDPEETVDAEFEEVGAESG